MPTYDARELVQLCAISRDPDVWREFLDRFDHRIAARVRRSLARFDARLSHDERLDLQQEVYCRLLAGSGRSLRRCRGTAEGAVLAYLGRVTESVVVDHLRSRSAAKRGKGRRRDWPPDSTFQLADWAVDSAGSPEERLLLRERHVRFLARCRKLVGERNPQRDLRVLYLAFFEGWTSREISDRFGNGMKPSTVDSLVHRVKARMKKQGIEVPRRRTSGPPVDGFG